MAKRIDVSKLSTIFGSMYPPPFDEPCLGRERTPLGDSAGLDQFGVNFLRLQPGAWSSQRHCHSDEDEFVYVLAGEVTMVSNDGDEVLHAGDAAGFKAGNGDGHCLQNRSVAEVLVLEIGSRRPSDDGVIYSDIDLVFPAGDRGQYLHRDGTPYPETSRSRLPAK